MANWLRAVGWPVAVESSLLASRQAGSVTSNLPRLSAAHEAAGMAGLSRMRVRRTVTRVAVFIDNQNAYMGARAAFGLQNAHYTEGQINPLRLAQNLVALGHGVDPTRRLTEVRIYRGEPSPKHSPVGQAACQRQVAAWRAMPLVTPVVRPLKYYPDGTIREKGIDVLIALDIAEGAYTNTYDVAILMSADTDLIPALERSVRHGKRVEVAAWRSQVTQSRLQIHGLAMWCHWLDMPAYLGCGDSDDYASDRGVVR